MRVLGFVSVASLYFSSLLSGAVNVWTSEVLRLPVTSQRRSMAPSSRAPRSSRAGHWQENFPPVSRQSSLPDVFISPSLPIGLLHVFSSAGELIHFALREYATYGIEPAIPALPCGITWVKPATETPIIK